MDGASFRSRLRAGILEVSALRLFDYTGAGKTLARLDCNEMALPVSTEERARWAEVVASLELNRYPDVSGRPLREALARRWGVEPDQILLGNGSVEVLALLMTALGSDGADPAKVLYPEPSFPQYEVMARTHGLVPVAVPLSPDFQLDEGRCAEAISRERPVLAVFASPNNPTGNRFDEDALVRLANLMGGAFVADEAYADFTGHTLLPRLRTTPSLFVLRSLSKVGLAGLRLGALVGAREAIADLDRVRLPWNVNAVSLALGCAALARPEPVQARIRQCIELRRELDAGLRRIAGLTVYPSEANFILVRTARRASDVARHLLCRGVLIKDVSKPGLLADCLRISVGTAEENERCLQALHTAFQEDGGAESH